MILSHRAKEASSPARDIKSAAQEALVKVAEEFPLSQLNIQIHEMTTSGFSFLGLSEVSYAKIKVSGGLTAATNFQATTSLLRHLNLILTQRYPVNP